GRDQLPIAAEIRPFRGIALSLPAAARVRDQFTFVKDSIRPGDDARDRAAWSGFALLASLPCFAGQSLFPLITPFTALTFLASFAPLPQSAAIAGCAAFATQPLNSGLTFLASFALRPGFAALALQSWLAGSTTRAGFPSFSALALRPTCARLSAFALQPLFA